MTAALAAEPVRLPETRCIHEMLTFHTERGKLSSCSVCRGLPYRPPVMYDSALMMAESDDPTPDIPEVFALAPVPNDPQPLRWIPSETWQECVNCGQKIGEGKPAAFVAALDGAIGWCCKDEVG